MKILLILISFLLLNLQSNELEWVDKQVEAIKPPRSGMDLETISKLHDPFIFVVKEKVAVKEKTVTSSTKKSSKKVYRRYHKAKRRYRKVKFNLSITMNKSAMINRKWYKVGDTINGYKISNIELSTVTLVKNNKTLLLSTDSKKNLNINFK